MATKTAASAPSRRHRGPPSLAALLAIALGACHSIEPYLDRYAPVDPKSYVVVAPRGRPDLPCVKSFLAAKRAQGFAVRVVEFDVEAPVEQRLRDVASRLERCRPADGALAYVLLLATGEELPPGPWTIADLPEPIESDLPLLLGDLDDAAVIDEARWSRAFRPSFPWIPGRIPFADVATLERALSPGAKDDAAGPPVAMLGAERYAVWWDTSLVMSRARRQLDARGWKTSTYAEDWPCDVELGLTDAGDLAAQNDAVGLTPGPCDPALVFVAHWAQVSPDVVYLNSHGSSFFTTSVGDYLLSAHKLDLLGESADTGGMRARPAHPAVVVIAACRAGTIGSDLTARLFRDGWASALVASMENTSPSPLWVAIWAEIDTAAALAAGLGTGLGLRAVRESYLEDAQGSWSYVLFDSTRAEVAKNLLALTLYGDPARPVVATATPGHER